MAISITVYIDKFFKPIGIRKTISLVTATFMTILLFILIFVLPEMLEAIFKSQGKDLTFTGRVDLWADIWSEAQNHLLLGAGFQGFWVVDKRIEELYTIYNWLPRQAHNGYLDILNELGIVGSILFLLVLINYFIRLLKIKRVQVWKWFVFSALITNITESALLRPKYVTGVMFIFLYLVLITDLNKQKLADEHDPEYSESSS